jgi:hypothetical protein
MVLFGNCINLITKPPTLMKTVFSAIILVFFTNCLSFGQDKPASLSFTSNKILEIKKASIWEQIRLSKRGLNPSDCKVYSKARYLYYLDGKLCNVYDAYKLLISNEESEKLYRESVVKFEKEDNTSRVMNKYIFVPPIAFITLAIIYASNDTFSWFPYIAQAALTIPAFLMWISMGVLESKGIALVKQAIDIYNSKQSSSYILPKPELKFGFTGNGIGIVINF